MGNSVEFYLAKGFDQKMAEYFAKGRKKITAVTANDNFTLTLTFDNEEKRMLNMLPALLPDTVFAPFRKLENFKRVYLDEAHTVCWDIDPNVDSNIVWSNKVNLCPDTCYVDSIPVVEV